LNVFLFMLRHHLHWHPESVIQQRPYRFAHVLCGAALEVAGSHRSSYKPRE
jgi:hypothetical protein